MSNISRRDFLKTAGVMTLAVAAAGVLAGCNTANVPAPNAGESTVTTNSVSYTGLYSDKLTVESVGRFNVYNNRDQKVGQASQTVLKVTYTKPDVSTKGTIQDVHVFSENSQVEVYSNMIINEKISDKTGVTSKDMVGGFDAVLNASATKTEKYIVLDMKKDSSYDIKTNDLKIAVSYVDPKTGKVESVILPLSVTASDLY